MEMVPCTTMNKQDFIMNWQQRKVRLMHNVNFYKNGKGVEQDYNKARRTLLRTGWQQTKAMPLHKNDLGVLYYEGKGVQQDCNKARHVCELAANQGNARARYNIGVLYAKGCGVEQDYIKAVQ